MRALRGSNAMALLGRPLSVRRWAERTVILLCMGTGEDRLRLTWNGSALRSERADASPPSQVAEATEAAAIAAREMKGRPGRFRFDLQITAHILGGAVPGDPPAEGVVDHCETDPVLDAREWVEKFQFEQHLGLRVVQGSGAIQPDERGIADGFGDIVVDFSHDERGMIFGFRVKWCSLRQRSDPGAGAGWRGRRP